MVRYEIRLNFNQKTLVMNTHTSELDQSRESVQERKVALLILEILIIASDQVLHSLCFSRVPHTLDNSLEDKVQSYLSHH